MHEAARAHIRLILVNADDHARLAVKSRLQAIYAEHGSKGVLHFSSTLKACVRAMEEQANRFISDCVDLISAIAKDAEAFAMLNEANSLFISFLREEMNGVLNMAAPMGGNQLAMQSMVEAAQGLFADAQARLERQLQIHMFAFTGPYRPPAPAEPTIAQAAAKPDEGNKGGRPRAEHWEDMWSRIAAQLYDGDLKPATQADIERAMMGWCVDKKIEIGETAIRERARKLWKNINSAP